MEGSHRKSCRYGVQNGGNSLPAMHCCKNEGTVASNGTTGPPGNRYAAVDRSHSPSCSLSHPFLTFLALAFSLSFASAPSLLSSRPTSSLGATRAPLGWRRKEAGLGDAPSVASRCCRLRLKKEGTKERRKEGRVTCTSGCCCSFRVAGGGLIRGGWLAGGGGGGVTLRWCEIWVNMP